MAGLSNNQAIHRWVQDHILHGELDPKRGYRGDTVRIDEQGNLIYMRTEKPGTRTEITVQRWNSSKRIWETRSAGHRTTGNRYEFGPVILAVYIPRSKTFLLNGDGFTDAAATRTQTFLRGLIQRPTDDHPVYQRERWRYTLPRLLKSSRRHFLREDVIRYVIVPFQAIEGAQIDVATVRPLDVTRDTNVQQHHVIPDPPEFSEFMGIDAIEIPQNSYRYREVESGRFKWRITEMAKYIASNKEGQEIATSEAVDHGGYYPDKFYDEGYYQGRKILDGYKIERKWSIRTGQVWPQKDGTTVDATLEIFHRGRWVGPRLSTRGFFENHSGQRWYWTENTHQLGASLFSAVGEDNRRHKFLSAFDNQENPPMYFLAQLPDGSGAKTYQAAMDALAPEIVHKAREDGRDVFRQGDIFAVETQLSDEDVYALARTRVSRDTALWFYNDTLLTNVIHGTVNDRHKAKDGELLERLVCPCGCGKSKRVPYGPRAKRMLSIYRTGHTATEVVTTKTGTTYIRGHLHHDPQIETPRRLREHTDIRLGYSAADNKRWFLAVRNTVPRQSRRRRAVVTAEGEETT